MKINGDKGKLEIKILRRSNTETDDYWDANWLEAEIKIKTNNFMALYGTNLRVDDLQKFYERLTILQNGDIKKVEFTTMEEGLYICCEIKHRGNIICRGIAKNDSDHLNFKFQTDLGSLGIFISELKMVLICYPLIGNSE